MEKPCLPLFTLPDHSHDEVTQFLESEPTAKQQRIEKLAEVGKLRQR